MFIEESVGFVDPESYGSMWPRISMATGSSQKEREHVKTDQGFSSKSPLPVTDYLQQHTRYSNAKGTEDTSFKPPKLLDLRIYWGSVRSYRLLFVVVILSSGSLWEKWWILLSWCQREVSLFKSILVTDVFIDWSSVSKHAYILFSCFYWTNGHLLKSFMYN